MVVHSASSKPPTPELSSPGSIILLRGSALHLSAHNEPNNMKDKKRGERAAPPPPPPPPGRGSNRPVGKGADKELADTELADNERADEEGADEAGADEAGADKEGRPEAVSAPESSSVVEPGHRDGEVRVEEPEGRDTHPPREAARWTLGRGRRGNPERDHLPVANPIDTSTVPVADLFQANGNTEVSEEEVQRQRQRKRTALLAVLVMVAATLAVGLGVGLTRSQPPAPTAGTPPSPQSPAPSTSPQATTYPTSTDYCKLLYDAFNDCLGYSGNGTSECEGCIRNYFLNRLSVDLSVPLAITCTDVNDESCDARSACSAECLGCTEYVIPFVGCASDCNLFGYNCTGVPPYGL